MKKTIYFALMSAALGLLPASAQVDCLQLALSVKNEAAMNRASVLEMVEKQVAANPSCACEVVKAAIEGAEADASMVASIVETASVAAPDQMRLISQCAVAVAPDSLVKVQEVLVKLDPNSGDTGMSAKSAKSSKEAPPAVAGIGNPLDFPGQSIGQPPVVVGPNPGGPGGFPFLPPGPPINVPPLINVPEVSP